jgi:hypothetical protein
MKALTTGAAGSHPKGAPQSRPDGRKINPRRPRYLHGSLGKTVCLDGVGPGGEYAGTDWLTHHVTLLRWRS